MNLYKTVEIIISMLLGMLIITITKDYFTGFIIAIILWIIYNFLSKKLRK
ncbi:putative PurR-regulated permease PerM [Peptoniphilus olsenii]|uniref:PurR-regulated permease PerM n=1 Tax=Peptoniphilus olsenii TaxID=411570 RepID=A0ABV2JCM1_9FIRM